MGIIQGARNLVNTAVMQLKEYQEGKAQPIRTRFEHFNNNCIGGIHKGMIITIGGIAGCVDNKTEYFNGKQWKTINKYTEGEKVLQYTNTGQAELVEPSEFHKYESASLWHIDSTYIDQVLSDEHNFIFENEYNNLKSLPFSEIRDLHNKSKLGFGRGRILTTWENKNQIYSNLSENELRFIVAVQADAHLPNKDNIHFNIKKDRKKIRLRYLLNQLVLENHIKEWKESELDDNYSRFYIQTKKYHIKDFPLTWYFLDTFSKSIVLDELFEWDAHKKGKRRTYFTTSEQNADIIQFMISSMGFRASKKEDQREGRKTCFAVNKTSHTKLGLRNKHNKIKIKEYKTHDGFKYCFTVPSGMLILRRNGNIFITGNSGKTFTLQQIEEDIFDKELNPNCDDYILLRCNWEMTVFKLLLRKLKRKLDKRIKQILFNKPEEDELEKFQEVCNSERSDQIFYLEEPTDPKTWYNAVIKFLTTNKDKKHIIITIDHIALVRDLLGSKKKAMDDLIEYINSLKKEFSNVSFIVLSQMNREIEGRTDVKNLHPKRSDLYNSDTMYHISDLILIVHNPFKLGHDKYMIVPGLAEDDNGKIINDRYAYLAEYMDKPNNKMTNFKTKGIVFWHYLKIREDEDSQDIAIEELDFSAPNIKDELEKKERQLEAQKAKHQVNLNNTDRVEKLDDPYLEDDVPF